MIENPWGYAKRLRFFKTHIPLNYTVLDVGCGNGSQVALPLSEYGYDVTGIDLDSPSIDAAKRTASRAKFACLDLSEIQAPYDAVIISEVLEHLNDPAGMLLEARRLVRKMLLVTTPNGFGEFELDKAIYEKLRLERLISPFRRHRDAGPSSSENHDGHVQFFTRRRLHRIFHDCGYSVVTEASGPLASGPLAAYAFNVLPAKALELNAKVTDYLPMWLASGWYFVLAPRS